MRPRVLCCFLLLVFISLPAWARADDSAQARLHFQKGTTLYDLGQYREAAQEYEAAYRHKNDPALLFNIGQAYRFAGANADALRSYRAYLRHVPDASNRAEVEGYIVKLQKMIEEQKAAATSLQNAPKSVSAPLPRAVVVPAVTTSEQVPVYKKWWLWTVVGGVAVVGAAVALAVVYTTPKDAPAPAGALTVVFP